MSHFVVLNNYSTNLINNMLLDEAITTHVECRKAIIPPKKLKNHKCLPHYAPCAATMLPTLHTSTAVLVQIIATLRINIILLVV